MVGSQVDRNVNRGSVRGTTLCSAPLIVLMIEIVVLSAVETTATMLAFGGDGAAE
jgi:hypothetical protein